MMLSLMNKQQSRIEQLMYGVVRKVLLNWSPRFAIVEFFFTQDTIQLHTWYIGGGVISNRTV